MDSEVTTKHLPCTASRLHRSAQIATEVCWLAAILLVPLAVNPWGFNYELPKVALFRGLTLLMLAVHIIGLAWSPPPNPRRWSKQPLVRPILLAGTVFLLSTALSISPLTSLWGTTYRQQGAYLMLCFIIWALLISYHLRTSDQRSRLVSTIVLAGTVVALTPLIETLRWGEDLLSWRPGGSLGNPIFLGAYLIMALPFTLAKVIGSIKRRRQRTIHIAAGFLALILQLFALFITQSRGPWLGALVGLVLLAALLLWRHHRTLVVVGMVLAITTAILLFLGLNFGLSPSSPLADLPYVERLIVSEDSERSSVRVRLVLWEAASGVVTTWPEVGLETDPWQPLRPLFGYGPDTGAIVYTSVYPPELAHIEDPGAIWDRAHNETIDTLTMTGWLGIAATAVLAIAASRRGISQWRGASNIVERAWAAAPLAALLAHVVEVQFAFSLTAATMMTWLSIAWLAAPAPLSWSADQTKQVGPEREETDVASRRWRIYTVVGAILLVALALRLEGGLIWADTLVARARDHDRAGEWRESVDRYDRALAIVPWQSSTYQLYAETLYNLAWALPEDRLDEKVGLLDKAEGYLLLAAELEPLELEHYSNLGVLHAYWSELEDQAHLETAAHYYELAFLLASSRAELRLDLGHVYHNHGLYDLALEQYSTALEIDPQLAQAHYDSGLAWLALEKADEARTAFQAALDQASDCEACRQALLELGE